MSKEIKDEEVDKLLEDELFREAKMTEKSLLGDHADEPSVSDEEIDKAYERFMQRVKKEGLQKENSQDTQTAEIVKFPGSRGMDKWERELEEIGRTVDDSWDDQDPVQEENNFVNELSNMIHPIEIEKPKSWYKLAKASGFILLAAIGLLAGSMASQADNAKFVSTIEHIIDHNTMP